MKDAIIFDIDGTLADVSHRRHFVRGPKKDWDSFFKEMVNDTPVRAVCALAEGYAWDEVDLEVFIFSGRPDNYRGQTENWLAEFTPRLYFHCTDVKMRKSGDYRPDTEVKRDMLNQIRADGYNPILVIDDRPSVIQMWKDEGITVLEHDSGEWDGKPVVDPGRLDIMVGPSGAGKSFRINIIEEINTKYIVSSDDLREEITGDFKDQSKNDQVWYALHCIVKARVNAGLYTVVDATNLHAADRRKLRDLCPENTEIHYWVIDRPLAEKHKTAGWRDNVVINGVKLIDKHHQSFQSGLKHILRGDDDPRVTVHDMRKT